MKEAIIIVDDNVTNLKIGRSALDLQYNVFTVSSGEMLFKLLERIVPDLILLDVEMPGMDGYAVIKKLKNDERTSNIPVVFLTAKTDTESEIEGFSLGATDYIAKPFSAPILKKRVETQLILKRYHDKLLDMVNEKTLELVHLKNAVLSIVAEIVEFRDDITGGHIERTKLYLKTLIDALNERGIYQDIIDTWDVDFVCESSLLHDVGKISITDTILMKPDRLTDEEFEIMKSHVTIGVRILGKIDEKTDEQHFMHHAKLIAETHHERWDGRGYPRGLKGEDIPLQGRLMAIADVYDALISERPYKKAFTHEEALKIIMDSSGTHFDPQLVAVFSDISEKFNTIANNYKD